jgi:hypothetical protein
MTKMVTLGAALVVAAMAAPVLAQDDGSMGPANRYGYGLKPQRPHYSTSCIQGPGFGQPCPGPLYDWSIGRDRSRVGGLAPSLRPSGS